MIVNTHTCAPTHTHRKSKQYIHEGILKKEPVMQEPVIKNCTHKNLFSDMNMAGFWKAVRLRRLQIICSPYPETVAAIGSPPDPASAYLAWTPSASSAK